MNKKKFIKTAKTVLMGMVVIFGMASCGNDDNVTTPKTTDEFEGLDMTLTYSVGEAQNDSVFTRGMAARPMTEKHTFMGMEVETSVTEDKAVPQTARTRATVYNTVNLEGKTVYAIVFDPATNKVVAPRQELTVSDGKITVRGKRGCRILFYIGSTPYVIKGNNLSTFKVNENNTTDPMQCVSDVITSLDQNLGTLSFKHVFSKIRVVLKTSDGTVVNAFRLTTKEKLNSQGASVNILNRSYTVWGSGSTMTFAVSGNATSEATADYQNMIVSTSNTPTDLTLLFAKEGKGATIGGSRNWLTDVNNALKLKSRVFQPGHRYSINITVKPSNTDAYLNSGYRADRNYYQWDAYEVYGVGDQRKWSAGNSGGRFGSYFNTSDASQSCRNCPSTDEMQMYIGAGVLIDDGHTGTYQQSYTITDPVTGDKTTYHEGVWLKKKQYIVGFDSGTAPKVSNTSGTKGRPTKDNISEYFFMPFTGFYDLTNFENSSAYYYHRLLFYAGESGYFMSRTAYSRTHFTTLKVSNMGAGIIRLNWTSNNLAAATVWTAD